jgi:hypothetical protein
LDDNIPEEKEVYQVVLYDVKTQGNLEFPFELFFGIFISDRKEMK